MGSSSWRIIPHRYSPAQSSAWQSVTSSHKQNKDAPMTITISTYEVSPRFLFCSFGESGHLARVTIGVKGFV